MPRSMHLGAVLAASAALLLVEGCTVGPDFQPPAPPDVAGYTPEPLVKPTAASEVHGGSAQRFVAGADIPGQWWTLFRSPALDDLIRQALAANPDVKAAQAALRQAWETALAKGAALYPSVDASLSATRQRLSGATFGHPGSSTIFTLANAGAKVSYDPDVFGGTRRDIEAAEAAANFQRWELEATLLSLTSNLVVAAVQDASLRAQIAVARDIIDLETQQLDLVRRRFDLGGAAKADVLAQEASLAQARAALPSLEKQLALVRDQLTALAGRFPSQEVEQHFDLAALDLPQDLPLSLPSRLVEQRPDVQAAQAQLHQASAEVGVTIAAMFPDITISADIGTTAASLGNLFTPGTSVWSLGAAVTQPLFHAGALIHGRRAAEANYDKAAAQYQSTVLGAFRNVADSLRALQADAEALKVELAAERAAADSLGLARAQYESGAIGYPTLLNAEKAWEQARVTLVQAEAARFADTAALFQALGGGWWNRPDLVARAEK